MGKLLCRILVLSCMTFRAACADGGKPFAVAALHTGAGRESNGFDR